MKASVDFEVFGRVQGVFFRACTVEQARNFNLVGWVRNTRRGTVEGVAQGDGPALDKMKHWLRYEGSPHSKIDKAVFSGERTLDSLEYEAFTQKRSA